MWVFSGVGSVTNSLNNSYFTVLYILPQLVIFDCKPLIPGRSTVLGEHILWLVTHLSLSLAGADKKAEAGAGAATEFQFVSIFILDLLPLLRLSLGETG